MAATKLDSMELEAMRMEDSSWHPCSISLSSGDTNIGIIVDFGNDEEEDVICNREDALARLRFRSIPLQGDECTNIKAGECVLAMQKTKSKSLFIDATVEEPKRVKHSKRVHCRCTFEIKWLNSELKGETATVPSKSILKFSDRSIDEHSVFSRFLNVLNSDNGGETPSVISFSEESSCEAEFIGLLEKQVEEISKLVDGSKASFTDLFLEVKSANVVKHKSKIRQGAPRRTTRSQNKNLLETEVKKETEIKKETEVKNETEVKPVLTPLAARAALASLVHELPEKSLGFSGEQSAVEATSNFVKSTFYVQNTVLLDSNSSKNAKNSTSIKVKNSYIESPNQRRTDGKLKSYDSSDMSATLEKEMKPCREFYDVMEDESKFLQCSRNSVNGEKTKISSNARRLTRSMQKELEASSLHMKQGSPVPNNVGKATISKSSSLEPQNILASSDDDVQVGGLTKKLSGSTNGTVNGNKAEELFTTDTKEIKKRRLSFSRVDSTSESNSMTERIEPSTKRRTRSSHEDDMGATMKEEESIPAAKKSRVSSQKDSKNPPLRSSPRLVCPPKTRSQVRS